MVVVHSDSWLESNRFYSLTELIQIDSVSRKKNQTDSTATCYRLRSWGLHLLSWMSSKQTNYCWQHISDVMGREVCLCMHQNGRLFVDAFVQRGMPMLDHMFRAHRDNIQTLLKHLQISTRALHHLCGHSKVTATVMSGHFVPQIRLVSRWHCALYKFTYLLTYLLTWHLWKR